MLPKDPIKAAEHRLNLKLFRLLYYGLGSPGPRKGRPSSLKGRTYEQIHGKEEAKVLRKKKSEALMGHSVSINVMKNSVPNLGKKGVPARNKGIPFSKEARGAMSRSKLALILSGKFHPHKNRFKSITKIIETTKGGIVCCQGSWEELYVKYLENNPEVVKFEKDQVRIAYMYNGKNRVYIVDFFVTYRTRQELIEIKPKDLHNKEENPEKFKAAISWSNERNIKFFVITKDEIDAYMAQKVVSKQEMIDAALDK